MKIINLSVISLCIVLSGCSILERNKVEEKVEVAPSKVNPIVVSVYQPYSEAGGAGRYTNDHQHLLELGAPRGGEYVKLSDDKHSNLRFVELKIPPPKVKITEYSEIEATIFFKSNSSLASNEASSVVDYISKNKDKYAKISLSGHADSVGSHETNKKLSQDRVASIVALLIKSGFSSDSINGEFFGEANPDKSNDLSDGRAKNRRVDVKVIGKEIDISNQPKGNK